MRGGQTHAFEKTKVKDKDGKEEEKWRQTAPAGAGRRQAKVRRAALGAHRRPRRPASSTAAAATALDKPELTVTLKFDEGKKEERVTFAQAGADAFARARRRAGRREDRRVAPSTPSSRPSRSSNSCAAACTGAAADAAGGALCVAAPSRRAGGTARLPFPARRKRTTSPKSRRAVRELQHDLAPVFGAPIMAHAASGASTSARSTPASCCSSTNAGKLMMPASNMKILTLAAAAEALGWDYRFTTTLETSGDRSRTACCTAT